MEKQTWTSSLLDWSGLEPLTARHGTLLMTDSSPAVLPLVPLPWWLISWSPSPLALTLPVPVCPSHTTLLLRFCASFGDPLPYCPPCFNSLFGFCGARALQQGSGVPSGLSFLQTLQSSPAKFPGVFRPRVSTSPPLSLLGGMSVSLSTFLPSLSPV